MFFIKFYYTNKMKILLILSFLPICYGSLCPKGEYWSTFSEICLKCTQCKSHQIIIRTCQTHKDTICSASAKIFNFNNIDTSNNNKKNHHFEKGKIHFITDEVPEKIFDNTLLEMDIKHDSLLHKHHNKNDNHLKKQRINDKFLKWDNDDDYNYDDALKKHKKHNIDHKSSVKTNHHKTKLDDFHTLTVPDSLDKKDTHHKSTNHHKTSKQLHTFTIPPEDYDDDDDYYDNEYDDNDLDAILDKKSKKSWDSKKWKGEKAQKNKNAVRLAQLEDEKKLEEWLIQSRKQFKDRKDTLLKTLKEEQVDSYENDKRIRLNYPLFNSNDRFSDSLKYDIKNNDDDVDEKSRKTTTTNKHNMVSDVELFKELIKNEESQELELATLMSNKKDSPFHYKGVTPSHRMYLGAPSDMAAGGDHIKDPQEVIKEEMGRNIIYEKSKFNVVPFIRRTSNDKSNEIDPVAFTAAERLVWDWQAVAVISAIASCLLFFLVIGIFVLANARQWRKDNHIYCPESEEMSTRVALIQPSLETSAAEGNNTNRFLQQFLSLNEDAPKRENQH